MIDNFFKTKYEFLSNYFETFLKTQKRFPQSIVFEGMDTIGQYFFVLELARNLNCEKSKEPDCNCTNCKWIKENKHPAVVSITPLDFKEDNTKTVISVKQIEKITSLIRETSDYHRFFIFSNAKTGFISEFEKNKLEEYKKIGFDLGIEDYFLTPLNRKILQEEASNALLKSTEEAPNKVTFVFLCANREDIISTITSRSFVFKTPFGLEKNVFDTSSFFAHYPNFKIEEAIERVPLILDMAENVDMINVLNSMQEYLLKLLKENLNLSEIILLDIKKIEEAKKQILALVSPKYVIENLFISLSYEGRNL